MKGYNSPRLSKTINRFARFCIAACKDMAWRAGGTLARFCVGWNRGVGQHWRTTRHMVNGMLSQLPSLFGDDIIHDNSGPQLGWFTIGFTTFNPIIIYSMLQLRKPAARLGGFFLRTKWYKVVWGQSGQNGRTITELGSVERGQLEHFWGVCTRWQLGDGGASITPWPVLGVACGEAIERRE